jgi:hypothetical protein
VVGAGAVGGVALFVLPLIEGGVTDLLGVNFRGKEMKGEGRRRRGMMRLLAL